MKVRILRWLVAISAWVFCVHEFRLLLHSGGGIDGFPPALFGFASFIAGVLLVSPEIIRPICDFFADRFVDVIYPGARADKPPLSYLLARRYRDQFRIEESIVEYEKILRHYPKERDAYHELLTLAQESGDERTLRKYQRRYQRRFGEPFPANDPLPPPKSLHD